MWIWIAVAFGAPKQITVAYTATYDIEALGDSVCGLTKICDCTAQYTGVGAFLEQSDTHVTFEGTWSVLSNSCGETFTSWTPSDSTAFHTLRHKDRQVTHWAVHEDSNAEGPLPVGEVGGRFQLAVEEEKWPTKQFRIAQVETLTTPDGLKVKATHDVSISLRK